VIVEADLKSRPEALVIGKSVRTSAPPALPVYAF
jgi:hypothetical protein